MSVSASSRILVVDDEPDIVSLLCQILEKEHPVITVKSGEMALELAEKEVFPVVILDLCLPQMSGLETLAKLRSMNSRLRIIILTSKSCEESAIKSLNLGAFKYLLKPFSAAKLRAFVREGMDEFRGSLQSQTTETVGWTRYSDQQKHKISYGMRV